MGWLQRMFDSRASDDEAGKRHSPDPRAKLESELRRKDQLVSREWVERWKRAAQALAELGDAQSLPTILEASLYSFNNRDLTDSNRNSMVESILTIDPRLDYAIPLLSQVLAEKDDGQKVGNAADVLGRLGERSDGVVRTRVFQLLSSELPGAQLMYGVRRQIVCALGRFGDIGLPALREELDQPGWGHDIEMVRLSAAQALCQVKTADNFSTLVRLVSFSNDLITPLGGTRPSNASLARTAAESACFVLQSSAEPLRDEDLARATRVKDQTETTVTGIRKDSSTDETVEVDTTVVTTVNLSRLRKLAQAEADRRSRS